MPILTTLLVLFVASLHVGFMLLEMVLWTRPAGRRIFRLTVEQADATRVLAANQGLYNGFLAAGLVWSVVGGRPDVALFFLACVIVAGVFGGLTVNPRIVLVQALPAAAAVAALLIQR